jgi:hypothetical protein
LQKNKIFIISILAAILVSGALSVASAQETPQVASKTFDNVSSSPVQSQDTPVEGDKYAPDVGQASSSSAGNGSSIEPAKPLSPIYEHDGLPAFGIDANENNTITSGDNLEGVPVISQFANTTDNSATAAAVGVVFGVAALGAVGIVCLSKHP